MHCHEDDPPGSCDDFLNGGSTQPILEYNHDLPACSVTGGYRYRGQNYPDLEGVYFYADFCTGHIWGAIQQGNEWQSQELLDADFANLNLRRRLKQGNSMWWIIMETRACSIES
jgi:hypothetical protein